MYDFKKIEERWKETRGWAAANISDYDNDNRGRQINGIHYEDCSSLVTYFITGEKDVGTTASMVDWQGNNENVEGAQLTSWGFKRVTTNPPDDFLFKKYDVVVRNKMNTSGLDNNGHTAMICQSGRGRTARMLHTSGKKIRNGRPPASEDANNFLYSAYPQHFTSVWRATHGIFIYDVRPLEQ